MLFNVPQNIDVEDKIAGPLTGKQLLWLIAMSGVLGLLWVSLEKIYFIIAAIPIALLFIALAFYRPYNQPFITFLLSAILFSFGPKLYIWKREPAKKKNTDTRNNRQPTITNTVQSKKLDINEITDLAQILDSDGKQRSEKILELIKRNQK